MLALGGFGLIWLYIPCFETDRARFRGKMGILLFGLIHRRHLAGSGFA